MRRVLAGRPEVKAVAFEDGKDEFVVDYRSSEPMGRELAELVSGAVVAKGARRWLGAAGGKRK